MVAVATAAASELAGEFTDPRQLVQPKTGASQYRCAAIEFVFVRIEQDNGELARSLAKPVQLKSRRSLLEAGYERSSSIGFPERQ